MEPARPVAVGDPYLHAWLALSRRADSSTPTPKAASVAELLSHCEQLAPDLLPTGSQRAEHDKLVRFVAQDLLQRVAELGRESDQGAYQKGWRQYAKDLEQMEERLSTRRFLMGPRAMLADYLLFCFLVRIDPVYFELFKANPFRLSDLAHLHAYARDLFELPELFATTDFDAIKRHYYLEELELNPKQVVPRGGVPELHAPHFRDHDFPETTEADAGTEEALDQPRLAGEWVRPQSRHRHWIAADGSTAFPAAPDRYHLYAPYNCPWSHRALLARSVKGLDAVVGATIVFFRRDPERGWQLNPSIPGCTADPVHGIRFVTELYERVGSQEKSVPLLWDKQSDTIVSNESAEILRMFNDGFGDLAERASVDLYPAEHRGAIDRINEAVYQRINNGAYKAGFTSSQLAYERAYDRYFAALEWLEQLLDDRDFLVGTPQLTEADLRLFPTLFRHDAVYFTRFKLNHRRIADYPRLSQWLVRMLAVPGVTEASNLDHARNGYFGRTGNGIVPLGPEPLRLSRADFSDEVWLGKPSPEAHSQE